MLQPVGLQAEEQQAPVQLQPAEVQEQGPSVAQVGSVALVQLGAAADLAP